MVSSHWWGQMYRMSCLLQQMQAWGFWRWKRTAGGRVQRRMYWRMPRMRQPMSTRCNHLFWRIWAIHQMQLQLWKIINERGRDVSGWCLPDTSLSPIIITLKTVNAKQRHIERNPLIDNQYLKRLQGNTEDRGKYHSGLPGRQKRLSST